VSIRVFVVDDSSFVRKALARALKDRGDIEVVGEAATGAEALAAVPAANPDVVTLDVAMAGMDGLTTLRALLAWRPSLIVIMLSAHTRDGASAALEALEIGAVDFIDKSTLRLMDLDHLGHELQERLEVWRPRMSRPTRSRGGPAKPAAPVAVPASRDLSRIELCVIGASTGGPPALQYLLERLPVDFPLPVAIVQHMPAGFTAPFAERLNALCRLAVLEAREGETLAPGKVLIAPAGWHLRIGTRLRALLDLDADGAPHVPSVDVLMRSASEVRPGGVLGLLLTGMGDDGADGMCAIRAGGGVTIGESEASCAVFGMPRAAAQRGGVELMLSLTEIGDLLASVPARPPRR
jgi:two-component system chemotaxis response regulator CheB